MIEVDGLTKHFGAQTAVADVTFTAGKGEILGFLGPNGAGKTTTMRMLTCYLPPTSGSARVAGFDIRKDSMEVRRRIGYLPESVPLYRDLTVRAYLEFVARLKGMSGAGRSERIERVLADCGIGDVRDRTIGKLSKGYRQRVGIAQALVNDPEVLILDEPTVGLDPRQIVEIRDLIRSLAGERTIILSTHILPEVSLVCQRVIIINKGRLISIDTPENLKSRVQGSRNVDVIVRGDRDAVVQHLSSLPGVAAVRPLAAAGDGTYRYRVHPRGDDDIREDLSRAIVGGRFGLLELAASDVSLEEIFVQLVTEEDAD